MVEQANGERYVSYRALLMSVGGFTSIILIVFGLYASHLQTKVDRTLYDRDYGRLCEDITKIRFTVEGNQRDIDIVAKNQLLVLRALKIEPVK